MITETLVDADWLDCPDDTEDAMDWSEDSDADWLDCPDAKDEPIAIDEDADDD